MKPVFDEAVTRELGYQKYWPELSDWLVALGVVVLALGVVGILISTIINFL